jgi:hypothetical protein
MEGLEGGRGWWRTGGGGGWRRAGRRGGACAAGHGWRRQAVWPAAEAGDPARRRTAATGGWKKNGKEENDSADLLGRPKGCAAPCSHLLEIGFLPAILI